MERIEAKLVAIHSIAQTEGGLALIEFGDELIEEAKYNLVHTIRADDFAQIAGAQNTVKVSNKLKFLLESDLEVLLESFGIEPEEADSE
jgi:hypothetical protein